MKEILTIVISIVVLLLVISILLQNKSGGVGTVFGGMSGGETYKSKRGLEKFLQNFAVILAVLFAILCMAYFVI
jgi:protein translocase SecG subunit